MRVWDRLICRCKNNKAVPGALRALEQYYNNVLNTHENFFVLRGGFLPIPPIWAMMCQLIIYYLNIFVFDLGEHKLRSRLNHSLRYRKKLYGEKNRTKIGYVSKSARASIISRPCLCVKFLRTRYRILNWTRYGKKSWKLFWCTYMVIGQKVSDRMW